MQNKNFLRRRKGVYESFLEPSEKPKVIYTETSLESSHTPHRSETNGIAERAVRRMKEGTSAVLLQCDSMKKGWLVLWNVFCYLQNVQDLLAEGKTPYERRFGEPFKGPIIPFGVMVEFHRFLQKTSQDSTNLVRKCYQECSSDARWLREEFGGDVMVADIEELGNLDSSEIHARKPNAINTPKKSGHFIFPIAEQQNCLEEIMKSKNQL